MCKIFILSTTILLSLTGCNTLSTQQDPKINRTFDIGADKNSINRDFGIPVAGPILHKITDKLLFLNILINTS